ncbi:hypothetical protein J6590_103750 [Homalodisca vitripennis]|nr:hypothetical protein J6590_103750 [Homalodisca vitripennis]
MASVRKKGQTIHSKARDVIRRVIQKCDEESNTGTLQHRLKQSNIRVANYTGISVRIVTSIRKEGVEVERPDIVNWRARYLREIHKCRHEGKVIVYLDETWVDNNLTFGKCWSGLGVPGVSTNTSSSNSEQDFWIKDGLIEDVIDHFVIELGGVDSRESDDPDDNDQSSSESDLTCPLD